eukprot:6777272-Pyramimonas_sp.AAC.1
MGSGVGKLTIRDAPVASDGAQVLQIPRNPQTSTTFVNSTPAFVRQYSNESITIGGAERQGVGGDLGGNLIFAGLSSNKFAAPAAETMPDDRTQAYRQPLCTPPATAQQESCQYRYDPGTHVSIGAYTRALT